MELKPIKNIFQNDYQVSKLQGFINQYTNQINALFLRGESIDVTINTTDTIINHGLTIVPNGWFLIDQNANSVVWRTAWTDKTITLRASAQVNVKLWVF